MTTTNEKHPRTWANQQKLIRNNEIMIARGKVDTDRGEAKVLVDSLEVVHLSRLPDSPSLDNPSTVDMKNSEPYEEFLEVEFMTDVDEQAGDEISKILPEDVQLGAAPILHKRQPDSSALEVIEADNPRIADDQDTYSLPINPQQATEHNHKKTIDLHQIDLSNKEKHTVVITLLSTGDKERDNRRLSQIYGVLTSLPGKDQFAFLCHENGSIYRLDFPNDNTSVSRALLRELQGMVGETNIAVE